MPRIGGIILTQAPSKNAIETFIKEDPFHEARIAHYEIIECMVTKTNYKIIDVD